MPPLNVTELNRTLVRPGGLWREIQVVARTASTNADLLAQVRSGVPEGLVLVAEEQSEGRGRMGRRWVSAPGAALTFSVLLRPHGVRAGHLGWVPLLAGVATVEAIRAAGVDARLKWPNDVLTSRGKLAGILAESRGDAVVVGIGLNVSQRRGELPVPTATSLAMAGPGRAPDRQRLLSAVLSELGRWYLAWHGQASPGDAQRCGLAQAYLSACGTVGREVTVHLPGGRSLTGTATGVDETGRLQVQAAGGLFPVSAGDVVHVR